MPFCRPSICAPSPLSPSPAWPFLFFGPCVLPSACIWPSDWLWPMRSCWVGEDRSHCICAAHSHFPLSSLVAKRLNYGVPPFERAVIILVPALVAGLAYTTQWERFLWASIFALLKFNVSIYIHEVRMRHWTTSWACAWLWLTFGIGAVLWVIFPWVYEPETTFLRAVGPFACVAQLAVIRWGQETESSFPSTILDV